MLTNLPININTNERSKNAFSRTLSSGHRYRNIGSCVRKNSTTFDTKGILKPLDVDEVGTGPLVVVVAVAVAEADEEIDVNTVLLFTNLLLIDFDV